MDRELARGRVEQYLLEVRAGATLSTDGILDALLGPDNEQADDRFETMDDARAWERQLKAAITVGRLGSYAADYRGNVVSVAGFIRQTSPTLDVVPLAIAIMGDDMVNLIRPLSFSHAVAKDQPVR